MTDHAEDSSGRERFWHRPVWVITAAMLGVLLPPLRIIVDDLWDRLHHDAQIALVICVWAVLIGIGLRWLIGSVLRPLSLVGRGRVARWHRPRESLK